MLTNNINHKLPSNRKFGFFFTAIFILIAIYFFKNSFISWSLSLVVVSLITLIFSIFLPNLLTPLNKYWFLFGVILGRIISPLILGFIFFLIIVPTGVIIRLLGRDELKIKRNFTKSYWKIRLDRDAKSSSFKNQF